MDEEIERLVVSVRADTRAFAADVGAMRAELDGPFASGLERAGRTLESSLVGAIQRGKFGFEDLRRVATNVLSEIASSAIQGGLGSLFGSASKSGGLLGSLGSILGSAIGLPGRATGGPVSPGRAYRVGENGPETFVPTSSGQIVAAGSGRVASNIQLTINVSDNGRSSAGDSLQRSSRHVARALRQAMAQAEN